MTMQKRWIVGVTAMLLGTPAAYAQNTGPAPTNPADTRDVNTPMNTQPGSTLQNQVNTQPAPVGPVQPVPVYTPTATVPAALPPPPPAMGMPSTYSPTTSTAPGMPPPMPELPEALRPRPNGLTAERAATLALAGRSPGVVIGEAQVRLAVAQQSEALRSMIPQLVGSFRYTRLSPYTLPAIMFGGMTISFGQPILDQFDARATLTIPITDILIRGLGLYQAAQLNREAQEMTLEGSREEVALQARLAYFDYVRAIANANAFALSVEAFRRHVADVGRAVEAGTVARSDLLRIESQLAEGQRLLTVSQTSISLFASILRQRTHMRADEPIVIGEALDARPPVPSDVTTLIQEASTTRPEVLSFDRAIRALDHNVFSMRAQQLPSLSVSGDVDYLNPNPRLIPQTPGWSSTWDLNVVASWSPTAAFVADATIDRYHAQQAILAAQRQQLLEGIEIQVRQWVLQSQQANAEVASQSVALSSALENLRVRRERVGAGAAVITDLFDAETDVLRARVALIGASINYRIALAQLNRAIGHREPSSSAHRGN